MGLQSLMLFTGKMDKSTHRVKQAPGNGKPQSKSSDKTAASGLYLIKIITHLRNLGICHANSGIIYIYNQVNSITLLPVIDTDVYTAFLRKLYGILQEYFQYMRNFLRVANKLRRDLRIHIKHHFQLMPAVLHGG